MNGVVAVLRSEMESLLQSSQQKEQTLSHRRNRRGGGSSSKGLTDFEKIQLQLKLDVQALVEQDVVAGSMKLREIETLIDGYSLSTNGREEGDEEEEEEGSTTKV